jgi:hypothetical protein
MQSESRRDFLGNLLAAIGGVAAAAVTTIGCATPAPEPGPRSADGVSEVVPVAPGNYYANVMPDHVPAVRAGAGGDAVASASDASGSKRFE